MASVSLFPSTTTTSLIFINNLLNKTYISSSIKNLKQKRKPAQIGKFNKTNEMNRLYFILYEAFVLHKNLY